MQTVAADVLTGLEPRRRFGGEEKRRIVAETLRPGARVSDVAREHGVHPNQLFKWRRQAREGLLEGAAPGLVPVVLATPGGASARCAVASSRIQSIEVLLCNGRVLRLDAASDPAVAARFAAALEGDDR